jgi:crotonobetainyl-CoA:carnitine CoA-transferase CaiB-like acyl-CoA transferase
MVRISGFGQDGPYAHRPGFGVIGEAVSGMRHITGDPDRPPARVAVSLTDYITGRYGAFGAVMAVMVARQTGKGQFVDSALYECAFSFMEPHIPAFEKLGHIANRAGPRLPDNTPNNLYPTGDGSFIHIAAVGEPVFRRFIAVLGRPELIDDPRFRTPVDRARNEDALDTIIESWTTAHDLAALEKALQEADVPATRIFTMADIFGDPHYKARQAIVDAPDAEFGSVKMANVVPRLSATPGRVRHAGGQTVGGDTRAVLREVAGLSDGEIEALRKSGIVACAVAAKKVGSHVA